ncbi:histone H1-like [Osmerus eperlanus]|uniref:histone H1-like n=1 Tax=Osmerus eperlanus TaxID=29151 RepID=UPI002E139DBB
MSGVTGMPLATPVKTPKKRSKSKKTGPSVSDRILKVLSGSKDRGGVSLAALKKALTAGDYDVAKNNARIKLAVRRLVANGSLLQPKGTGASGSFKINKQTAAKKKKDVKKKAKSPKKKVKRIKKKSPNMSTGSKSPTRKKRKAKTPKKAKKLAAAKTPRSPKRATRRVASTRSKAAAKK